MTRPPLYLVWHHWIAMQLADILTAQMGRRAARRQIEKARWRA